MPNNQRKETDKEATAADKGPASPPAISLPKGGGAIRGIGEKFAANPVTGTGSMSVPIATSPGRSGFGPQLSLSYDSGAGNGPFGFGWNLSLPQITRKTDKGLPQYRDAEESDVFILSGAEDLVPVLVEKDGKWEREDLPSRTVDTKKYQIQRYRPRIEGLFARIERWTNQTDLKDTFWRSISKDNITTWYGKTENSRIADTDPEHSTYIFSWLICESYDNKGNVISYHYKEEDSEGLDGSQAHESNRTPDTRKANRYLKRIKYGNRSPYFPTLLADQPWPTVPDDGNWLFEVVFDYLTEEKDKEVSGQHYKQLAPDADGQLFIDEASTKELKTWGVRQDPFSSYRAGFEVRTYRLCHRALMFHHFPNELDGIDDYLVRSTEFTYEQSPIASFITSVAQSGYRHDKEEGKYLKKSLPPLEFEYSKAVINEDIQEIDAKSLENLPNGLDGSRYQWVDLDGEGLSGVLTEQADTWFYKPNLGDGKFGPLETVALKPSLAALTGGRQQLLDLAGDGRLDLVELSGPVSGFYERTEDQGWEQFRNFVSLPNIPWNDPNLRFVDLTGDGHADVLITEDNVFTWYPSLAEEGFERAERVSQALDEEKGPRLVFADGTQSVYLADISGDGLSDLVRIRNGEVCYWPNLGYGKFGSKVTMDNSPWLDGPDLFDQKRIRLGDIDGSGTTDIIYLNHSRVAIYRNECGNSWSDPEHLNAFAAIDDLSSVMATDLLGNGTACLVWSSPLPGDARRPMRYIDLMGGQKPHLLTFQKNNLGAETRVQYAPSTKFYLADKLAGKPWVTKLPFPVHVVERVGTYDRISRNRFVTRYTYHHGYFDGLEREFRGFGMVEQWDTEEISTVMPDITSSEAANLDQASFVPPAHTKTWFHTGAYLEEEAISLHFVHEYYGAPRENQPNYEADFKAFLKTLLPDTILPKGLTVAEEREACRALKGAMLRQEVYADDGSDKSQHPYTVTEQNFTIERLQARGDNQHGVFFTHAREAISYHYERNPADPRISHALALEVDGFGNVLKSVAVGYGRPQADPDLVLQADRDKQTTTLITYTENDFTNAINDPINERDNYRTPLPSETVTYELTGLKPDDDAKRFSFDEWIKDDFALLKLTAEAAYEENADLTKKQRRPIEHVRTRYRKNDLTALLPLHKLNSLALPGESYKLAFTPGLLNLYAAKIAAADLRTILRDEAKYIELDNDGRWWIPSGRVFYSPDIPNPQHTEPTAIEATKELAEARKHFFMPRRYRDPFFNNTVVDFDGPIDPSAPPYDLLVTNTRDPLGNEVHAEHNYRVLQPALVTDLNGNRTEARYDALGMIAGTAVMGKVGENKGDLLQDEFKADLSEQEIADFFDDPKGKATSLLGKATTRIIYDLGRFKLSRQPAFAATSARETHFYDPPPSDGLKIQVSFSYSDGFGREIQKKIQAEKGPVPRRDPVTGRIIVKDGIPEMTDHDAERRWVGSGWTIFNNKGKPVRQYEPFFSDTHHFDDDAQIGVSPVLFYDPVERVVATLHPNHTYEKVVFDPWQQTTWDVNDTLHPPQNAGNPPFDPKDDPDVGGYFRRLPHKEYLPAWYDVRTDAAKALQQWPDTDPSGKPLPDNARRRTQEKSAAAKAAVHANTPTVAYFDTLGRTFLTVAHNKFERKKADGTIETGEGKYPTRINLDIEGNQREVWDEWTNPQNNLEQRVVMRYDYDMLGNRIHQASMEAGERWMLNDVMGKPIYAWDSRGFTRRMTYDVLRRPTELSVSDRLSNKWLGERTIYGESQGAAANHRGRVYQVFDGAGIVTHDGYDFKGNLLRSMRRLVSDYKSTPDWSASPQPVLEAERFISSTRYDALNRFVQTVAPHSDHAGSTIPVSVNTICPGYNEANLLESLNVWLNQASDPSGLLDPGTTPPSTHGVKNIDYNAKGQRTKIEYKNNVTTTYDYDADTFRLIGLLTTRPAGLNGLASLFANPTTVQDLHYTYDPVGNITNIDDDAIPTIRYNNENVDPNADYIYDAIYRLIFAHSREHIGQTAFDLNPPNDNYRDYPFFGLHASPNDPKAVRNYTETYDYDEIGNIKNVRHSAQNGSWTRAYTYDEQSLLEAGKKNNRLTRTQVGNGINFSETYGYADAQGSDVHGCMTGINSMQMTWDFKDQLQTVNLGGGGKAYYVYDVSGQRMRKVWEKTPGLTEERIYLGSFEIYREYNGDVTKPKLERETLHITDDMQRIALVETKTINDSATVVTPIPLIRYQFSNHLSSAGLELDDGGNVISYEEFYPYGSTSYQAVRKDIEVPLKRYRYTGKERDEETGLYYHGARYYAPWTGRWVSCDPAGSLVGSNLYMYGSNNPLRFTDPSGNAPGDATDYAQELLRRHPEAIHNKTGWETMLKQPDSTRIEKVAQAGTAPFEHIMLSKATLRAAQIATDISLGVFGGEIVGPALALLPRGVQVGLAVLSMPSVFTAGVNATEAVTGTSILNQKLDLGERLERGASAGPTLLGLGFGYAQQAQELKYTVASLRRSYKPGEVMPSGKIAGQGPGAALSGGPEFEQLSSQPPVSEGTYKSQGGHHVHQSASYSPGGPSGTGNPNHADAVTVALEGHSTDLSSQHGRATAATRLINRGALGRFSGKAEVGPMSIGVSGEGTLPPTPNNQSFEDVKAFFSMSAADAPGYQSGEDVLGLVRRSADQLPAPPVRVPSR